MRTRVCTKCGEEKPETEEYFHRDRKNRGGLSTICKECKNKASRRWHAKNPERARDRNRRWQSENPEKVRENVRRWQAENPEKVRETKRRWYAKNTEKVRDKNRRWYADNREKEKERTKIWQAENPEKVKEAARRRRNTLAPYYLKILIANKYDIHYSEIGEELIEAKRREIKYYRQLKQLKK